MIPTTKKSKRATTSMDNANQKMNNSFMTKQKSQIVKNEIA